MINYLVVVDPTDREHIQLFEYFLVYYQIQLEASKIEHILCFLIESNLIKKNI